MNASEMIEEVRQMSGAFDGGKVFDGYPADENLNRAGPRILKILNRKVKEMWLRTKFNKCYFDIGLTAAEQEYIMPCQAHDIENIQIKSNASGEWYPIPRTTTKKLDVEFYGSWRKTSTDRALAVYFIGTRSFGIYPTPLTTATASAGQTITFLATSQPQDMVLASDVPAAILDGGGAPILSDIDGTPESALPLFHHMTPCYGAAFEVALHLGNNELAAEAKENWERFLEELQGSSAARLDSDTRRVNIGTGKPGSFDYRDQFSSRGR